MTRLQVSQAQWRAAGQRLIEMLLAEFLYEEIIEPAEQAGGVVSLKLANLDVSFVGGRYQLGHWYIEPGSVRVAGDEQPGWDLHAFVVNAANQSGVKPFTLAHLVREMNNTWLAEAHLMGADQPTSEEITHLPANEVEGVLRGHPWVVMSKGRVGFSYADYLKYAPESRRAVPLLWVAVTRGLATFRGTRAWAEAPLYAQQLGQTQREAFADQIRRLDRQPGDYLFIPVHPWQWENWIVPHYAGDIASADIIELGITEDTYTPMQSIRTLSNQSHPHKHYVKLPLTILNTAVYRGLPADRNLAAPAVTAWLHRLREQDVYLQSTGLVMLGEVATVTVRQPAFDGIEGAPYQFKELFGCLWRESVQPYLSSGEQALSQAALVHRDHEGRSVLKALISRSGLASRDWLAAYFQACVPPLLYCLYRYGLAFSAHGENSLLIHENGAPTRMVIKDFVDDINLVDEPFPELNGLPNEAAVLNRLPASELAHFIFTGLFIVHYRYLANIYTADFGESEQAFWTELAEVIEGFHQAHPELQDRASLFNLQRAAFEKVCLNRVRLFTQGYADDAERPVPAILPPMPNPISRGVLDGWRTPASTARQNNQGAAHA